MIRANLLGLALAAVVAAPALAAETQATFSEQNARQHLANQGFTNISDLQKDANGKWSGTAFKDGKRVPVAVGVRPVAPSTTN